MTRQEARTRGRALVKRLKGKGWKVRIYENLGWHYAAFRGTLSVFPTASGTRFHSLLGDSPKHPTAGAMFWSDSFTSTDPNRVVRHQLRVAKQFADRVSKIVRLQEK